MSNDASFTSVWTQSILKVQEGREQRRGREKEGSGTRLLRRLFGPAPAS